MKWWNHKKATIIYVIVANVGIWVKITSEAGQPIYKVIICYDIWFYLSSSNTYLTRFINNFAKSSNLAPGAIRVRLELVIIS